MQRLKGLLKTFARKPEMKANYLQTKWPIGLLQLAIHEVQNRHAGEQKSHWDKTNKRHT